ncbi:MAG: hypothetical protein IKE30_07440 [Clostridia bacterium]|nr:hypothetical protein [Clostridia bacterium]
MLPRWNRRGISLIPGFAAAGGPAHFHNSPGTCPNAAGSGPPAEGICDGILSSMLSFSQFLPVFTGYLPNPHCL